MSKVIFERVPLEPPLTHGIILAGGTGSRLTPLTLVANKHLLAVYSDPMIYYPIATLRALGITEIMIVSGGEHIGGFAELLGDGHKLGVALTYRVQERAGGIAEALACAEGFTDGSFAVILGDNYFSTPPEISETPQITLTAVTDPRRFGVYDMRTRQIIEKPEVAVSSLAVTGFYIYDQRVFDFLRTLVPSARGELEITDVNNWYLRRGMQISDYEGYWSDMGTHDSLLEVANYVKENK